MVGRKRQVSRIVACGLVAFFSVVGTSAPCAAQEPPHWRVFTSTDGLRESWVEDVTQSARGRVWITHGAVDSLSVFDGYSFRRLPSPGVPAKLREGPTGQVWALWPEPSRLGTYRGLQFLDGERWTTFPLDAVVNARPAKWQFVPWAENRVLLLTEREILEFDRGSRATRVVCRADDTSLLRFTELTPADDGGAWIGGPGGLLHLANTRDGGASQIRHVPLPQHLRIRRVVRIREIARRMFVSLELDAGSAALDFDGTRWRELSRTTDSGETVDAWPGRGDEIWIAATSALGFRLTRQAGECCGQELERTRAFSGRLHAVEPLADGGFWLATSLGLVRHAPAAWESPRELAALRGVFGTVVEASTGDLYALHDEGLLRRQSNRWTLHRVPAGFTIDPIPIGNVVELSDGRILFSTLVASTVVTGGDDALLAYDPKTSQFTPIAHPEQRFARVLGKRQGGGAWLITRDRRSFRLEFFDGQRFATVLDGPSTWATGVPRSIVELEGGDLVVVPDGDGVGRIRQGRHDVIGPAQGYPGSGSFAVLALDQKQFWFGDRDGIMSFDGDHWQTLRVGLQTVRAIVRSRDGSIWVASGSGLHRFRNGNWTTISAPEGLPDGSVSHLLEDRNGTIWVTTTAGLSRYIPEADRDAPETSLGAPGNPAEAPPSGDVQFVFAGLDRWAYTPADRLLYSWRLDGGTWSHPEPRAAVLLERLAAGRHRLEVRAADRNWNVDASPAAFEFVVLLPWYRESGFLAVAAFGSIAILVALGLFVSRHVRLERLVAERTAALADINAQLRTELADRQRGEQERAALQRQLHQAQKLEAVGRLAGGIAHDFNNLLTVIIGFGEFLRDELGPGSPSASSIDEVLKAAERAASLTRQVTAFSRHQIIEPKPLDLNAIVGEIERMLRRLIGEDIALTFVPGARLWTVLADRGQIEQVIVNLAVNARDAMPDGGQLTIETSNVELDDAFVRAHAGTRAGPHVLLAVTDTGVGMDAETRSKIFEPFFTTKAADKGSGLGLATVYGIVAQSAGHIWVESEPGRGTRFTIYLPRAEAVVDTAVSVPNHESVRGTERILIVEDDQGVRSVAVRALQALGYVVDDVASGEAALARLHARSEVPDLLLTDVILSGMSGADLANRVRQARPDIRVLFMSGHVDPAARRKMQLMRDASMIEKPFTVEALSRKVREVLDTEREKGGQSPSL